MMHILSERTTSQTGSELFRLFGVISFDAEDAVVLNVKTYRTSSPAVKGGCGSDNFYTAIDLADSFIAHFYLLINLP
jgi:hypothetical protein